jgi:hypothetical protein
MGVLYFIGYNAFVTNKPVDPKFPGTGFGAKI